VTVEPDTVQTAVVVEASMTVSPELAVALTVKGETPKLTLLRGPNVIVCGAAAAPMFVTSVATAFGAPPPDTAAWFVTWAAAFEATFTVTVTGA
jgi:hypothetical protein